MLELTDGFIVCCAAGRVGLALVVAEQNTLVELLRAWRHVQGWVLVEEVHRLQRHFDHFAGHHREVFNAR